jgi:hypothetical protein
VDQIFHADNAVLAEVFFNERIVGQSNALLVDLTVTALVNELANGLKVGISISNPRLDDLKHLNGCLCQTNEDAIVNLKKTKQLQNLARLGGDLIDTTLFVSKIP